MYADDHHLCVSDNSTNAFEEKLNANGKLHHNGTKLIFSNATNISATRCYSLMFTMNPLMVTLKEDITNCKNLKLLGVTIDSNLMFRSHIQEMCINTSKTGVLPRLKNMIDRN